MKTAKRHAALRLLVASFVLVATWPAGADDARVSFQSPSGNVHCVIETTSATEQVAACELLAFTGTAPRKPADCDLDWVAGASVDIKGNVALFACQGDTIQDPEAPKLDYGKSIRRGAITCSSATTGITCRTQAGRGFLVSRAVVRKL